AGHVDAQFPPTTPAPAAPAADAPTATRATPEGPVLPAAETGMVRTNRLSGHMSPKAVVASGHRLVFAQNMMYTHTISAFRAHTTLADPIPDSVDLSSFGVSGHPGQSKGSPVEAAFTADGHYAYVSNYSMYGANWGPEGDDECTPKSGYDDSFL